MGRLTEQADHDDGNGANDVVPEEGDVVVPGTQATEAMPAISPMNTPSPVTRGPAIARMKVAL